MIRTTGIGAILMILLVLTACKTPNNTFQRISLAIQGTPQGGTITLQEMGGLLPAVTVSTAQGDTAVDVAARLEVAVENSITPLDTGSRGEPRTVFPGPAFLGREGTRLMFLNAVVGSFHLTSTDSGLATLVPVANLRGVKNGDVVQLTWDAVISATGYRIFADGVPLSAAEATAFEYKPLALVHGLDVFQPAQDTVTYQVVAHREEIVVSPPRSVTVRVR